MPNLQIGIIDGHNTLRLARKFAFCKALAENMSVKEINGWLADFEEVEMPPPAELKRKAKQYRTRALERAREYCVNGKGDAMKRWYKSHIIAMNEHFKEISATFDRVDRHNAKILNRLKWGQYGWATAGLVAGAFVVVIGTAGTIALASAAVAGTAGSATVLGIAVGTESAAGLAGVSIATNISVSSARGFANSEQWSGIAVAGGKQGLTETKRQATGFVFGRTSGGVEQFFASNAESIKDLSKSTAAESTKLSNFARIGGTYFLPIVFAASDLHSEVQNFRASLDSPNERAKRHQQQRG